MYEDARLPHGTHAGDGSVAATTETKWRRRLGQLKDRADVARIDGIRTLRDRAAIAASAGRAQVELAQEAFSVQARRRPLAVTGLAAAAGVIIGLALRARSRPRPR